MSAKNTDTAKYNRILLKLSGEVFQNKEKGLSIDPEIADTVAQRIKTLTDMNIQISIVVGGGNIFRGLSGASRGIDRTSGDYMGMLATVINGLALQNALKYAGVESRVMTAIEMNRVAEPFILKRALRHLSKGRVLIFSGGTGNPYFSTDSAAALRASEINADVLLKATKVDGIYSEDPMKNPDAEKFTTIKYTDALEKQLGVMDSAAFSLCMDNKIPIIVFNFFEEDSIEGVVTGKEIGTLVSD